MKRHVLYLTACLVGLTGGLRADAPPAEVAAVANEAQPEAVPPQAPAPTVAAAAPVPVETPAPAPEVAPDQIVIDYHEAEMQNVVRTLATKAGINLIVGEEIIGKVTVHLEGVGYEDAMRLIVESKGYGYVKDKNVVRIKTKESLDAEPVEAQMVTLNYSKADEVKKILDPLLSRQGKIQVDVRGNALVLVDTPANLLKLLPLLERMDAQTPQVMIEAKFVETTKNPKKDLGINWSQTLLNHEVVVGGSALSATPGDPPTIPVDSANKPLGGLQWAKPAGNSAFTPWSAGAALLDVGRASFVFSLLSQDADSELLANPRVVTVDNGKAKIAIAQQYPIPSFAYSESKGAFTISGFDYRDIGIVLNVTPRINKNEFVTLEVAPEAGSQAGVANFQGVNIPIIDNRTASTTVLIKSGNTLAIGGLMRQDTSDQYTKVPIMGDIPGLGALFRSKSLSKTKRDLLIFLTPTIIAPDGQTGFEQFYTGLPPQELYTNDKWLPRDNAKPDPRNLLPRKAPVTQNFGP